MHLRATPPNEGARLLARWIAGQGPGALDRFAAAIGHDVATVDRLLSGEIAPGLTLRHRVWLASEGAVGHYPWTNKAEGGWFDAVSPRFSIRNRAA